MNYLKLKYIKYIILILFLYILFSILIRTVNIYTILFLLIIVCSCIYLIGSFINSIFAKPISNNDRLIIIKKNIRLYI